MIPIHKSVEPDGLSVLRQNAIRQGLTQEEAYATLKGQLKEDVRNSLVAEQGQLCAYCMCHIPRVDVDDGIAPITVEHFDPRNPPDHHDTCQGLDYNNLLAVCNGNRASRSKHHHKKDLTCDAFRGNKPFKNLNPCIPETLETIEYGADGTITATDPDVCDDLNKVLNLNCPTSTLIAERKAVYDGLTADMANISTDGLRAYCMNLLSEFEQERNPKTPFVGIIIWYLKSMLESLERE